MGDDVEGRGKRERGENRGPANQGNAPSRLDTCRPEALTHSCMYQLACVGANRSYMRSLCGIRHADRSVETSDLYLHLLRQAGQCKCTAVFRRAVCAACLWPNSSDGVCHADLSLRTTDWHWYRVYCCCATWLVTSGARALLHNRLHDLALGSGGV